MHTTRWLIPVAASAVGFAVAWRAASLAGLDAYPTVAVATLVAGLIVTPLGWWASRTVPRQRPQPAPASLWTDPAANRHRYTTSTMVDPTAVDDFERVFGSDLRDTVASRNSLAAAYQRVGRMDEAIELYIRTLADCERLLGPDHPDTVTARNNLAYACQVVGLLDEAIVLYTRTLDDCELVHGPDHPDTVTARNNLAYAYDAAGRTDEVDGSTEGRS
jgi:tetratricopeptide (TPR) repeat protein